MLCRSVICVQRRIAVTCVTAAAAASPLASAVLAGQQHKNQEPPRFHFDAAPRMHLALRHCSSSSSSSSSSATPGGGAALESKTGVSEAPPNAAATLQAVEREHSDPSIDGSVAAMISFVTWWNAVVYGTDKDGKPSCGAKVVKFHFEHSIDDHCDWPSETAPATRRQRDAEVYRSLTMYMRARPTELEKLVVLRKALAIALRVVEPVEPVIALKRENVIDWLRDMLVGFKDEKTAVFSAFPSSPMLVNNQRVVAALHDRTSPMNRMLDVLQSAVKNPPVPVVADLLRTLRETHPSESAIAAANSDPDVFPSERITCEVLFSEATRATYASRFVAPPVMVSHLVLDGGYKPEDGGSTVDPATEEFLIFVGESGSGKTISALQYALSRWARVVSDPRSQVSASAERAGIYMLSDEVFGPAASTRSEADQHRQQQQGTSVEPPVDPKATRDSFVLHAVTRKVLEMLGAQLHLSSSSTDAAVAWCKRKYACEKVGEVPLVFAPSAADSCITVVIDEMGAYPWELRGLIAVAEAQLCKVLAEVLRVDKVRVVAVGTGADGATVAVGSIPARYRVVRCGGRRDYWAAFEAKRKWKLPLTQDVRRLLRNPRVAALFAQEVDTIYLFKRSDPNLANTDAVRMLAMQSLPVALLRFRSLNGLRRLVNPVTAMLHALYYADSGAVSMIPSKYGKREGVEQKWHLEGLLKNKERAIAVAQDEWMLCGTGWGLLTDRATMEEKPDRCIASNKSFAAVFNAVAPVVPPVPPRGTLERPANDTDRRKHVNLPKDGSISRFQMSPAMVAATLFEVSERLQHDARIFGAAAGPSLEQDIFDVLVLRALAPPLDARFCDFSRVSLLRHIVSGLGNVHVDGNVHHAYSIRQCRFPIHDEDSVKEKLANVRCVKRESSTTAGKESIGVTVSQALRTEKAAIIILNGPYAEYADIIVLSPKKLVLVQSRCFGPDTKKKGESDINVAFGKMGWPGSPLEKPRCTTRALVELCRGGSTGDFTVEQVFLFSGSNMAQENPDRLFVTHGPFPFRSEEQKRLKQEQERKQKQQDEERKKKQPRQAKKKQQHEQEAANSASDSSSESWTVREPLDNDILYRRWIIHSGADGAASRKQYLAVRDEYLAATAAAADGDPDDGDPVRRGIVDMRDALFECSEHLHALSPLIGSTQQEYRGETSVAATPYAGRTTFDLKPEATDTSPSPPDAE